MKRFIISIIGGGDLTSTKDDLEMALSVGKALVDNGYRIITGGYGGVMYEACKGAHESAKYHEGDTIGIITSLDSNDANPFCDIVIATGIGYARNQIIIASGDAVIAIGGGSGTLSEIAFAWQLNKPIFAFSQSGWSGTLAGKKLDNKREDYIKSFSSVNDLLQLLNEFRKTISIKDR